MNDNLPFDGNEALRLITENIGEFSQGFDECQSMCGMTYDDDPEGDRSSAYDLGRSLGESLLTWPGTN